MCCLWQLIPLAHDESLAVVLRYSHIISTAHIETNITVIFYTCEISHGHTQKFHICSKVKFTLKSYDIILFGINAKFQSTLSPVFLFFSTHHSIRITRVLHENHRLGRLCSSWYLQQSTNEKKMHATHPGEQFLQVYTVHLKQLLEMFIVSCFFSMVDHDFSLGVGWFWTILFHLFLRLKLSSRFVLSKLGWISLYQDCFAIFVCSQMECQCSTNVVKVNIIDYCQPPLFSKKTRSHNDMTLTWHLQRFHKQIPPADTKPLVEESKYVVHGPSAGERARFCRKHQASCRNLCTGFVSKRKPCGKTSSSCLVVMCIDSVSLT